MKKLLLIILITLLTALSVYIVICGFQIGNVEVLSYNGIRQRNHELDEKIQEASKLAQKDFKSVLSDINTNTKKLISEKKEYEDLVAVNSEGGAQSLGQIQEYKVEALWVKLGTCATSEGVSIQIDMKNASTGGKDKYDLNFTVRGSYISITDFISDLENDSMLGFKIEGFRIGDSSGNDLTATFTCKNITILEINENVNSSLNDDTADTNTTNTNTTNTNTTNTTKSNTTNTTNS